MAIIFFRWTCMMPKMHVYYLIILMTVMKTANDDLHMLFHSISANSFILFFLVSPTVPTQTLSLPFSSCSAWFSFSCDRPIGLLSACMMLLIARILCFCHFKNLSSLFLALSLAVCLSAACHCRYAYLVWIWCVAALRTMWPNDAVLDKICENCTQSDYIFFPKRKHNSKIH